ncbi:glycosyltransferase family 2 protein [Reyranella sp.]|uniref:glycosyltransferase family 2 protein n=1 Tax=Reyranella sp. TaxID=1929291 RepID=UPI003D1514E9
MPPIAIIIPFYQRKAGILARSLDAVLAQTTLDGVAIHIVDDGSPIDPIDEIGRARAELGNDRITLHRKPNSGPGAARNYALDRLREAEVVAFLDSDDRWPDCHIANIKGAISRGGDLYFADYRREGDAASRFEQTAFAWEGMQIVDNLREFAGDLFSLILVNSPIGTPTVAYRFAAMSDLRFREGWRAGEDTLFWLQIAQRARKVFFSPSDQVICGRGVNIFAGCEWGTIDDLVRLRHVVAFHMHVQRHFKLSAAQSRRNREWLAQLDHAFLLSFLSALRNRQPRCLSELGGYVRDRPSSVLRLSAALRQAASMLCDRRLKAFTR